KFYKGDPSTPSDKNRWYCIRGGNWYVAAAESRSGNRCRLAATSNGNMLGFRVLRAIPEFRPKRAEGAGRQATEEARAAEEGLEP
ncbi:MAG: hypothetical protein KAI66_08205, partial [Lentisphaeria bacterium]|nr:hypothetical protein [Lentisphaeria bacterium]